MRNLTELLQEIPLDEMTGGLNDMKMTENNERTITDNNSGARIRSKAPAAVAVAACAVVAVFGAVQMANNKVESGASVNNSHTDVVENTATDAEDTVSEYFDEETLKNYELSRLIYDSAGRDYDADRDKIRIMEGKVGEITSGFDGLDMRISSLNYQAPNLNIEVAVQTKDGSEIAPHLEEYFNDIEAQGAVWINGKRYGYEGISLHSFGDTATGYILITPDWLNSYDLSDNDIRVEISEMRSLDNELSGADSPSLDVSGEFTAEFKVGTFGNANDFKDEEATVSDVQRAANEAAGTAYHEAKSMLFEISQYRYWKYSFDGSVEPTSKEWVDNWDLAAKHVRAFDDDFGKIEKGYEDHDIIVTGVRECYPFYQIDIGINKIDNSEIAADEKLFAVSELTVDGEPVEYKTNIRSDEDNNVILEVFIEPTAMLDGRLNSNSDIHVKVASENENDVFSSDFKAGNGVYNIVTANENGTAQTELSDTMDRYFGGDEYSTVSVTDPSELSDNRFSVETDTKGYGNMDLGEGEHNKIDFTIRRISGNNCGVEMNITIDGGAEDVDPNELAKVVYSQRFAYTRKANEDELEKDPSNPVIGVQWNYEDGYMGPDYNVWGVREDDGSYTLYDNLLRRPLDFKERLSMNVFTAEVEIN